MSKFTIVIISLAITSIIPTIALAIVSAVAYGSKSLYVLHYQYALAFLFSLYIGLPLFYLADKFKLLTPGVAIFAGILVGFIPASYKNDYMFFYVGIGALTGYGFWVVWDYLNRRYGIKTEAEEVPPDEPNSTE